jgi:superfamily II DNA/RNA helicase
MTYHAVSEQQTTASVQHTNGGRRGAAGEAHTHAGAASDEVHKPAEGVDGVDASPLELIKSFDDMELSDDLLRGVYSHGFETPSLIQQQAIAPIASGKDTLVQAQSGTGKTATFTIGLLSRLEPKNKCTQAVVLSPTRELAKQTFDVITSISSHMDVNVELAVGGTRGHRAQDLQRTHVVVGTPGRILDYCINARIDPKGIHIAVLDEADVLLEHNFESQIYDIFRILPSTMQAVAVSATLPPEAIQVTKSFLRDPVTIRIKSKQLTLRGIQQFYVDCETTSAKLDVLFDLYEVMNVAQTMVFVNTKRAADYLAKKMEESDFSVSVMHADLDTDQRNQVMDDFRRGASRILLATDVMARGIDVQTVSVVINYDLPRSIENYIHRIGRCGRFGRRGLSINLLDSSDTRQQKCIEHHYETVVNELPAQFHELL